MRRPLLVLVLLATIAVSWAQAAFAAVHPPSGRSQRGRAPRLQKLARRVVAYTRHQVGVHYSWGGTSPRTGFDCSGLAMYVFAQVGVSLPHSSYAQYGMGSAVSRDQLQPGDLVFFDGLGHVGIYVGGGSFIHAPHTGDVVKISSMTGWYASMYVGARRV